MLETTQSSNAAPTAASNQIVLRNSPTGLEGDLADLAPELMNLVRPIVVRWEAAALRVAAAHTAPQRFPLPAGKGTPESVLVRRFRRLPEARRVRAGQRAVETLDNQRFQRRVASAAVGGPSPERLLEIAKLRYQLAGVPTIGRAQPLDHRKLTLELTRLVCIDETDGFGGSEWGRDEIDLGGVALDETADIGKIKPFRVGSFNDGTRKELAGKRVFTFDLAEGATYPKSYFVTFVMVEADNGDFSETMDAVVQKLAAESAERLTALILGSIGAGAGGPLGALIGMLVGYIVGKVVTALIRAWEDDPFEVRTIEAIIPSATARLTDPSRVVRFTGPGEYALRYAWSLSGGVGPVHA